MGYRDYLLAQGLSERTVRVYETRIDQAIAWAANHRVSLFEVTATDVTALSSIVPNTSSSRRQLRTALTHYWQMTGRPAPPVKAVRVPAKKQGRCRAVEPDEARALVKSSLGWRPQGTAVLFGLYLGLRVSEIASVRRDRFDDGMEWYQILGKGSRTHDLPVHPILRAELASMRWPGLHLFPGQRGRAHVSSATVWNWVQEVAAEIGLNHLQTHQLRHTAIATVHDSTGDLRAAQTFARHARPDTTMTYTRTTSQKLVDAVMALDYLA